MTVGLDGAAVEADLCSGLMSCPVIGCGAALGPWGSARERIVRGVTIKAPSRTPERGPRHPAAAAPTMTPTCSPSVAANTRSTTSTCDPSTTASRTGSAPTS